MTNLDFLNLNSLRNYPIQDDYGRVSVDGILTIPNDFIVDMSIAVPNQDSLSLYISKISNTTKDIYIEITSNMGVVGTFLIDATNENENVDYRLTASSGLPNSTGIVTIGTVDSMLQLPSGEFSFDSSNTPLLMRVYAPATVGVNYITFTDAKGNSTTLTGNVTIIANSNLQFRVTDTNTVALDAGENLGLNKNCDTSNVPIKTINGVSPDIDGNFYLTPSDCVAIENAEFGLVLSNSCGTPCIGCTEIGTLTDRLVSLESDILTTRDYVNNVQNVIDQLTNIINYQSSCG